MKRRAALALALTIAALPFLACREDEPEETLVGAASIGVRPAALGDAGLCPAELFPHAICSCNDVVLRARSSITGDVAANDTLLSQDPSTIAGGVWATDVRGKLTISGLAHGTAPLPCDCAPALDVGSVVAAHRTGNRLELRPGRIDVAEGSYYLSAVYLTKPVTLITHGHTTLYVDGNLETLSTFTVQHDGGGTLEIVVAGTVITFADQTTIAADLYAPKAKVLFQSRTTYAGSILAADVEATDAFVLQGNTHDPCTIPVPDAGPEAAPEAGPDATPDADAAPPDAAPDADAAEPFEPDGSTIPPACIPQGALCTAGGTACCDSLPCMDAPPNGSRCRLP